MYIADNQVFIAQLETDNGWPILNVPGLRVVLRM